MRLKMSIFIKNIANNKLVSLAKKYFIGFIKNYANPYSQ